MFLVNPNFDCQVENCIKDKNGRFIILDLKADDWHLILVNIYAPNDSSQQITFFKNLQDVLSPFSEENIIIGVDFNCPLTSSDKLGGRPVHCKQKVIDEIQNSHRCTHYPTCGVKKWRQTGFFMAS